ncbi:MAG: FAD-dependent oxidoreductase, partial [Clostridia bacterium]|nr:FAD-dependent oxidoreductase [Clostridia bacterium]
VLALRGHKPVIFEKSERLGGVFNAAASPSFKEKDRELLEWYAREIEKLGIEVRFGCEIKPDEKFEGFDEVVVATGGVANKPRIPGLEKTVEAIEYLSGAPVGHKVVVIGGGLTGCEIAYDLYKKGHEPVIVEMKNDLIAVTGVCLANSSYLRDFFALNKVDVRLETRLSEVGDGFVKVENSDGSTEEIACDTVIASMGYHPAPLTLTARKAKMVGDCVNVGNLRTVVWRAWDVAMKI